MRARCVIIKEYINIEGFIDLIDNINSYGYGDYAYTVDGDLVTRKDNKCVADKKYITYLYGYLIDFKFKFP